MKTIELPKIIEIGFWISTASLFVLTILTFIGVLTRYVIFSSIPWAIELSQLLLMWMVYFGTAAVAYNNDHIVADLLSGVLSEKGKRIRQLITNITIFVMLTIVLSKMIPYTISLSQSRRVTPALGIPQWFLYVTFVLGLMLLDGTHLWNVIRDIKFLKTYKKGESL